MSIHSKNIYTGVALAVIATIIWSGNFIVARGVAAEIPPISMNFYRWLTGSILLLPFAWSNVKKDRMVLLQHRSYLFWTALTGIAVFNTLVYIAGHYTSAINMALIGTTSSPIFATILAAFFLKEVVKPLRIAGLAICITGIVVLLSQGEVGRLINFRFSTGDWFILSGAFFFAVYNTLVRRKPALISAIAFLFVCFLLGTVLLFPFFIWEISYSTPVRWNRYLFGVILYLGAGTSLIAYLCWNSAIARLGSSRTAIFGNLIPVFASLEAVMILGEKIRTIHIVSGALVITGLVIANLKNANR